MGYDYVGGFLWGFCVRGVRLGCFGIGRGVVVLRIWVGGEGGGSLGCLLLSIWYCSFVFIIFKRRL